MAPPRLQVRVGDRTLVFEPTGAVRIGRAADAEVSIDHGRVSRSHVVLRPDGEAWLLEDADSKNGTWHDGQRIKRLRITSDISLVLGLPDDGQQVEFGPVAPAAPQRPPRPQVPEASVAGLGVPSSVYQPAERTLCIGRAPDNDIVISDLEVSRRHAELRPLRDGRFEIVDVGSKHGTFLDGQRIRQAKVREGSLIGIGHHMLRFVGGHLEDYVDTGAVTFDALGLHVHVDGHTLLDDVSFALEPNSVLAIAGPSGAGKTTLMRALTGFRPADTGTVRYNGRDLYGALDELRSRIGYVPQDDLLHEQLTPRQALDFAAALRFPSEVGPQERNGRINEVLRELGIEQRSSVPIHQLSGGQRKRTNVALELLTRPGPGAEAG
jgi:ABC transport system ATP-binding/permease protein